MRPSLEKAAIERASDQHGEGGSHREAGVGGHPAHAECLATFAVNP